MEKQRNTYRVKVELGDIMVTATICTVVLMVMYHWLFK